MAKRPLRILQVSFADFAGGAEKVAWNLFQSFRARGNIASLAVGHKRSGDRDVLSVTQSRQRSLWLRSWWAVHYRLGRSDRYIPVASQFAHFARWVAAPRQSLLEHFGIEDFDFPDTHRLLELTEQRPTIVHCHNLHGGYFDLRALSQLSSQVPVVLTLHDAWLLSGHCAHSLDCERWMTGCGHCPYLSVYPAVRRDATAYNWRRKRRIYATSRLYVATPSQWLMRKVEQSVLAPAIIESRVIPNGVDLSIFRPVDRSAVRTMLKIPLAAPVILFAANGIRHNVWKDYGTLRAAIARVAAELPGQSLHFIALGEEAPNERIGMAHVQFIPYENDAETVARYYQAADVYVHAAKADTFPNTVLEALACGIPVVATAVGGITEQLKGLGGWDFTTCDDNRYGLDEATGVLVSPGDSIGMARGIQRLLADESVRYRMGENAAQDARRRFDLQRQVESYVTWYEQLLEYSSRDSGNRDSVESTRGNKRQEEL